MSKLNTVNAFPPPSFSDTSTDGSDYDTAVAYLRSKFLKSWKGKTELFHFVTCNIDTDLTQKTFSSIHAMLVSDALKGESSPNFPLIFLDLILLSEAGF